MYLSKILIGKKKQMREECGFLIQYPLTMTVPYSCSWENGHAKCVTWVASTFLVICTNFKPHFPQVSCIKPGFTTVKPVVMIQLNISV